MQIQTPSRNVMITGVSAGIGLSLTRECLRQGMTVLGTSRHAPELGKTTAYRFVPCDLDLREDIAPALKRLLQGIDHLDLVVLNAAILGPFGDLPTQSMDEMLKVMQVNLWANKTILDVLYGLPIHLHQVVAVSSSAAINLQRGWGAYGISKAALNALITLASREHSETHFCALSPCPVDTNMQDQLCSHPPDERFPSLDRLRKKRGTSEMPEGDEYAPLLLSKMLQLPGLVPSGSYADMRELPSHLPASAAAAS